MSRAKGVGAAHRGNGGDAQKKTSAEHLASSLANPNLQVPINGADDREDDFEWAIDHSTRRFRVRPYRWHDDHDPYVYQLNTDITIIDLRSWKRFGRVNMFTCVSIYVDYLHTPGYWQDADEWAAVEWKRYNP